MSKKIGNIELFMGPHQLGSPDNIEEAIITFINKANKELLIAVQEIDNENIAKALIEKKKSGVLIQIVLEADYLVEKKPEPDPSLPKGEFEENRRLQSMFLRSSVYLRSDFNPSIFHQKFIVRDNEALLTGSANFTITDTSQNFNHVVIIEDKKVAKSYVDEFDEIRQGHFGKLNEGHDPKPQEVLVNSIRVKPLFAPDHMPEMEIMKQMAKAKKNINFAIFTFAQSSGIDDQMLLLSKNGIKISGIMFKSQANQEWAPTKELVKNGLNISLVPKNNSPSPVPRKLHHKLMIIDEQLLIVGSFNYTAPANLLNDENILIIGDLKTTDTESIKGQKELAKYALDDLERINKIYGEKVGT
jgi:phosphatidylserine/phosphatidylglycerophosphate/cardiolipin synthase-like enzyme